jgi:hypothetical protein
MIQVDTSSKEVKELCGIIREHGYQRHVRLRQLHRHLDLPNDNILVESSMSKGYWTVPTPVQGLKLDQICGQIFSVSEGALIPTEFRYGPSNLILRVEFQNQFVEALQRNDLHSTLGIEVVRDGERQKMVEFSDDQGSMLFDEASVPLAKEETLQCTGWGVTEDGVADQTGEVRCVVVNGAHQKIRNSHLGNIGSFVASKER